MEQQLSEIEEVQHPDHWLKIEKLVDGVWVNTGWAEDEKVFRRHAAAVGGQVRLLDLSGTELCSVTETEYVPAKYIDVDSEIETCYITCTEHN